MAAQKKGASSSQLPPQVNDCQINNPTLGQRWDLALDELKADFPSAAVLLRSRGQLLQLNADQAVIALEATHRAALERRIPRLQTLLGVAAVVWTDPPLQTTQPPVQGDEAQLPAVLAESSVEALLDRAASSLAEAFTGRTVQLDPADRAALRSTLSTGDQEPLLDVLRRACKEDQLQGAEK